MILFLSSGISLEIVYFLISNIDCIFSRKKEKSWNNWLLLCCCTNMDARFYSQTYRIISWGESHVHQKQTWFYHKITFPPSLSLEFIKLFFHYGGTEENMNKLQIEYIDPGENILKQKYKKTLAYPNPHPIPSLSLSLSLFRNEKWPFTWLQTLHFSSGFAQTFAFSPRLCRRSREPPKWCLFRHFALADAPRTWRTKEEDKEKNKGVRGRKWPRGRGNEGVSFLGRKKMSGELWKKKRNKE